MYKKKSKIDQIIKLVIDSLKSNKIIFTCGNGGSASQASHFTAELLGRYNKNRKSLPSIALNSNDSVMTCISNDFGYENIFSRQLEGLGKKSDLLISFSTSGNSLNVLKAINTAKKKKLITISFLGNSGGACKGKSDYEIVIKSNKTALIQEKHLKLSHIICEKIDRAFK